MVITLFMVTEDHHFQYQSKACMRLPTENNINLHSPSHSF